VLEGAGRTIGFQDDWLAPLIVLLYLCQFKSQNMSININIKSSSDKKFVIAIEPSKKVLDLKEAIAAQTDVPADRQRLIFSGRVLKDDDLLSDYKVADGNTIHMVKGAAPNQAKGMCIRWKLLERESV